VAVCGETPRSDIRGGQVRDDAPGCSGHNEEAEGKRPKPSGSQRLKTGKARHRDVRDPLHNDPLIGDRPANEKCHRGEGANEDQRPEASVCPPPAGNSDHPLRKLGNESSAQADSRQGDAERKPALTVESRRDRLCVDQRRLPGAPKPHQRIQGREGRWRRRDPRDRCGSERKHHDGGKRHRANPESIYQTANERRCDSRRPESHDHGGRDQAATPPELPRDGRQQCPKRELHDRTASDQQAQHRRKYDPPAAPQIQTHAGALLHAILFRLTCSPGHIGKLLALIPIGPRKMPQGASGSDSFSPSGKGLVPKHAKHAPSGNYLGSLGEFETRPDWEFGSSGGSRPSGARNALYWASRT